MVYFLVLSNYDPKTFVGMFSYLCTFIERIKHLIYNCPIWWVILLQMCRRFSRSVDRFHLKKALGSITLLGNHSGLTIFDFLLFKFINFHYAYFTGNLSMNLRMFRL